MAIKKVRIVVDNDDEAEILADFEREGQIMRSLRHPNILQVHYTIYIYQLY